MEAAQYEHLRDKIQNEIDRLEEMENERAKEKDYANALALFHHRLGLQHAWQIIVKSEIIYNP